jgi:hypothetical protein
MFSFGYFPGVRLSLEKLNLTPAKYPKENIQVSEHGENLKSRINNMLIKMKFIAVYDYKMTIMFADDKELNFPLDDETMLFMFLRPCKYYPESAYTKVSSRA